MAKFVEIEAVYDRNEERNLDYLAKIYDDKTRMRSVVHRIFSKHFTDTDITGKSVLLKPNWVRHDLKESDYLCLRTNDNLLLCVLEEILVFSPSKVLLADAPIQGCDWSKLLSVEFVEKIEEMSVRSGVAILIKDFRRVAFSLETNQLETNKRSLDDYIIFDVADKSYLEEITTDKNLFRVTCYDPDRLAESHHKGMHKYCIAKDVFDCDIIITMPKIKTHQKAGLTNSMKILVGINGDKDYLPHHRIGAVESGGDCYKGKHPLRKWSELILDAANRNRGKWIYRPLSYLSAALWRLSRPTKEQNLSAGWYGNDTVWRMVMDLNMIAEYGKVDGSLSDKPQRTIYTLCDGIVAGQGNGPLYPDPLALGVIAFANDAFAMDEVAGRLFKLDLDKVPLLKEAKRLNENKSIDYYINGSKVDLSAVDEYAVDVVMPPGWTNYNKQ